jgi:hypothetical protein
LSNDIKKITINQQSGEIFFATSKGICSFRSTATEGGTTNSNILVFPNPVPPGYNGTIAIRGLVNNAIVKITEMDGRWFIKRVPWADKQFGMEKIIREEKFRQAFIVF